MKDYQRVIAVSRYARWLEDENRRETWEETVDRYCNFVLGKMVSEEYMKQNTADTLHEDIKKAIINLEVMPSMRALMTAGPAMERCNVAAYNCSYLPIDNVRSFDELMYILMCFAPETLVKTNRGAVPISELVVGDFVSSFDEITKKSVWKLVENVIKTKSSKIEKMKITLENGQEIKCTHNHKWLTSNRGWVEASMLSVDDDLISPTHQIYKITNKTSRKSYVGFTGKDVSVRWSEHKKEAFSENRRYNTHFYKAVSKYGLDDWETETIDVAYSLQEAKEKEKHWISTLNTKKDGYNSTDGGDGTSGLKWTGAQKESASVGAYQRTLEHRKASSDRIKKLQSKINETKRGDKHKELMRIKNTGSNDPMFGYVYSEEEREVKRNQSKTRVRINGRFA